ncbi:5756_t:CDS:1, partial [Dentiscutata heterogama]
DLQSQLTELDSKLQLQLSIKDYKEIEITLDCISTYFNFTYIPNYIYDLLDLLSPDWDIVNNYVPNT